MDSARPMVRCGMSRRSGANALYRASFGYLPAGMIGTFQSDLKSDVCAFTSSSEAAPAKPRR